MTSKKREKVYAYSASITMRHIQWLQSYPKPQEALRKVLDEAMRNSLKPLKRKEAKLLDMYRILGDALKSEGITEKRREEIAKRMRSTWEEYQNVQEEINFLKASMR